MNENMNEKFLSAFFDHVNNFAYRGELSRPDIMQIYNGMEEVGLIASYFKNWREDSLIDGLYISTESGITCLGISKRNLHDYANFVDSVCHEIVHHWQWETEKPLNHNKKFRQELERVLVAVDYGATFAQQCAAKRGKV